MKLKLKWILSAIVVFFILRAVYHPSGGTPEIEYEYAAVMPLFDYNPVSELPEPILPDLFPEVLESAVIESFSGSSTWVPAVDISAGDSIPLEISLVGLDDGSQWVKVTISGEVLKMEEVARFKRPPEISRWKAHVEISNSESAPIGVGIGYQATKFIGIGITPSISIGISEQWIAPEIRFTLPIWSGIAGDLGFGYRFIIDPGTHISAGIGISL